MITDTASASSKTGVRTQHPDYQKYAKKWKRCRDVMSGQDAVHSAGEAYLPKLKEQAPDDYRSYVLRAGFYNASWRTVAGLTGMIFAKPPKQDLPAKVTSYLQNVNLQGSAFDQFSQDITSDVLEVGRIGLLVDHPQQPIAGVAPLTVAAAENLGLRPVMKTYEAETIINWKFRNVNNATVLSMVVLTEVAQLPTIDEFGEKTEPRYRVLDLNADNQYRVRVFRIDAQDKDEQVGPDLTPLMDGKPLSYIPFQFIGPDGTEACVEEPPLIDLVDLNLAHYRVTADYEHGCHFTGLPTPWISGYTPTANPDGTVEKLYIGSQSAWIFRDVGAKAEYLEFTGDGLKTLRANLDAKKQEMATLGARMLADTSVRQVETFGATAIKHVAENSILAAIANSVSKGLTQALQWFCDWSNAGSAQVKYDLNRDFLPVQMDAPTLTALMLAWQQGGLSEPELFDLFKRGDLIEPTKTMEQHQAEIDANPPPAPPGNTQAGALGTKTDEEKIDHQVSLQNATQNNQLNGNQPPIKKAA